MTPPLDPRELLERRLRKDKHLLLRKANLVSLRSGRRRKWIVCILRIFQKRIETWIVVGLRVKQVFVIFDISITTQGKGS